MTRENNELKDNLRSQQKEVEQQKQENQNFSSIQSFNTNMEIPFNVNVCKPDQPTAPSAKTGV